MRLSKEELIRYSRQLVIPDIGVEGQLKIKASKVAVVGAGGLGTLVLGYLAGAGVGEIGLFDSGPLELSNLHRQLIYRTGDVGELKTKLAKRYLSEINPDIKVTAHEGALTVKNIVAALKPYDHVADCTDNFSTRAAINKACLELGKTYVHGAVYQFAGQITVFEPGVGPCLACLVPDIESMENQACSEAGVMGPAAGAIASMQALEILKLILGLETMKAKFATMDFQSSNFHIIDFTKQKDCPVCGDKARLDKKFEKSVHVDFITPEELNLKLVGAKPPRLLDLRYEWEHDLSRIKGDSWADLDKLLANGPGCAKDEELVLYCKGQSKSIRAYRALRDKGFTNVLVLKGGIDAWAEKIDPTITKY